jgi:hypothetical protein
MENFGFKTRLEVAGQYRIDVKTLISRLKEEGIVLPKGRISPKWLVIIYEVLGPPPIN